MLCDNGKIEPNHDPIIEPKGPLRVGRLNCGRGPHATVAGHGRAWSVDIVRDACGARSTEIDGHRARDPDTELERRRTGL